MYHCQYCPLAGSSEACPWSDPVLCGHVAKEVDLPEQSRYWTSKLLRECEFPPLKAKPCHEQADLYPATATTREAIDLLGKIKLCPHRSTEGCGCGGEGRCAQGKGRAGKVYHPDCMGCLADRPGLAPDLDPMTYVTTERLTRDVRTLVAALPPDVDLVAAIPRSGLLPGSLLAYHLHLTLVTVSRQTGLLDPGHGIRLDGRDAPPPRHIVLVDDTVARGKEMTACFPIVRAAYPDAKITRAVVYANPQALHAVDLYVSRYPGSHYLEWNWPNAGHGAACAYDFDGVLCQDCPAEDDDGGPRYLRFLAETRPLFLPRRSTIPLIVTGRHERYRAETLDWLDRHGLKVDQLVMRGWDVDPARDWSVQMGEFKTRHYDLEGAGCVLFAESCPIQARVIADLSGRPVLCPTLDHVLTRSTVSRRHEPSPQLLPGLPGRVDGS